MVSVFQGLGIGVGDPSGDNQLIPFTPDINAGPPFSFMSQTAEGQIKADVVWNMVGKRYWMKVYDAYGNLLQSFPLVASPARDSQLKINLLLGVSASKMFFYEDIQAFEVIV